jgi:hypothetical protein
MGLMALSSKEETNRPPEQEKKPTRKTGIASV